MKDIWGILMRKDDPLSWKNSFEASELDTLPLICSRQWIDQESPRWLGAAAKEMNIVATYNLVYNASLMVEDGLGYAICFDRLINTTGDSQLCIRPLVPRMENAGNLIWKKYQVFSPAVRLFIEEIRRLTEA